MADEIESLWIPKSHAARMLSIGLPALDKLIDDGYLAFRSVPGSIPKVLRQDVERLAAACTVPSEVQS